MFTSVRSLGIFICALLIPASVLAQGAVQAGITGVVSDSQGGVLPGVTVEVSSPALIEKVRTVVTDGTGRYRVTDLPTGTYSITFTLTGFASVRQEGISLAGSFSATVNAQMRVGALEETIHGDGRGESDRGRTERASSARC
jgi:outer membrane protein assembly factor BamB